MIDSLEINQGTLAGPLQRLVVSGALTVERGHARGADRRVKVYRLTPLGERLVEELRKKERAKRPAQGTRETAAPSGP
ncbi:MAG: helix-turn-helix transcriptional regulator [Thermoplasmata archaeon]|nr:helix-turn-helix transcriptional regulator [Thermoplasmata archaeon]MCI4360013.1 helix-turn-helix transcriptional regulator [Thermoplasmata archaeon]